MSSVSILNQFLSEYNELYYKSLNKAAKDNLSDGLNEIRQVEKIMTNPKFHPTAELKGFYKALKERYSEAYSVYLLGSSALSKIIFINVLAKDSIIPISNNALLAKKFIIKYNASNSFVRAYFYKADMMPINLHTFDMSLLDDVEYFEVFCNAEILKNIEIIKDCDTLDKKALKDSKSADLILWIYDLKSKINKVDIVEKILKKKQSITILTHINKTYEEQELLELISSESKNLDKTFGLNDIYDINLWNLFYEYRLDEKFVFYKTFGTLNKQAILSKTKSLENALNSLKNAKTNIESFYSQKEENPTLQTNDKTSSDKLSKISELIESKLKFARNKRSKTLLKEALNQNKLVDSHYKILFQHYKSLDNAYHAATLKLISKFLQLNDQFNKDVRNTISKSIKKYLDSIVDSILDNIEVIKVRTRPANPSFFDNLTNRLIVYNSFQVNSDGIFKELLDSQSFLARKHKSLITRINHFNIYIEQNIQDSLRDFGNVVQEWIEKGHHLVLQKKPNVISMDTYFSLEEFNLGAFNRLTATHFDTLKDYVDNIHTRLLTLSIWVDTTKKILLECVIQKLNDKFQNDKNLAKERQVAQIKAVDRDFIIDSIIEFLPLEISNLFCTLGSKEFSAISTLLTNESKENEKLIRSKGREIMELRQSMKMATRLIQTNDVSE
ncbi:hypothetical protein DCO58_03195 [Helicobacter saguini]|uniref:Uncharacterized protein n=1 Tax=Helicobacter saguini TaxID=1548018 RepID=A0A347VS75_9HELI|nr:hypothetical protein [Helicobacter saguini]MWV62624.1 hypothetical protein [Helicobacter saguini]MWV66704.1 hypothetical protein [Helicobacter saguini]MWV69054.1 hypothetical protein [Helicobacter saguini]MWV71392.1 hypothetical protein [Helicobacter saguini]TLD94022.1 hypothetical protein LS64_007650 [Helicobacter saguini]